MKAFFLTLFLSFSAFSYSSDILLENFNWETLTQSQKNQVLETYRKFIKYYEKSSAKKEEASYSLLRSFSFLLYSAHAQNQTTPCFYGGWPSIRKNDQGCQWPQSTNPQYLKYEGCPTGELLCNPSLFGRGFCAKFSTKNERLKVFEQCEALYQKKGSPSIDIEGNDLILLAQKVDLVCNSNDNLQSKTAMCESLKDHILRIVPLRPQNSLDVMVKRKQDIHQAYSNLKKTLENDVVLFETHCLADPIPEKDETLCYNLSLRIKESDEQLTVHEKHLLQIYQSQEECKFSSDFDKNLNELSQTIQHIPCLEKKSISQKYINCTKEMGCSVLSTLLTNYTLAIDKLVPNNCISSHNSCVANLVSEFVQKVFQNLKDLAKLFPLLLDGAKWAWGKAKSFWSSTTDLEDNSSNQQAALSHLSDEDVEQVKESPWEFIKDKILNFFQAFKEWMKEDLFCQKWSGNIPRTGKCLESLSSFDCLSCSDNINALCIVAGSFIADAAWLTVGSLPKSGVVISRTLKAKGTYNSFVDKISKIPSLQKIKSFRPRINPDLVIDKTFRSSKYYKKVLKKTDKVLQDRVEKEVSPFSEGILDENSGEQE